MHSIGERLGKEAITNPAIEIQESPTRDYFEIRGRGEMQLGILVEEMRREGFEIKIHGTCIVSCKGSRAETNPFDTHIDSCSFAAFEQFVQELDIENAKVEVDRREDPRVIRTKRFENCTREVHSRVLMHLAVLKGYLAKDEQERLENDWDFFTKDMPAEQLWQIVRQFWHGAMLFEADNEEVIEEFKMPDFATA